MYFHISLSKTLSLPPKYFGQNLSTYLKQKLHSEVEGTCSSRYGFIIAVTSIEKVGNGKIEEGGLVSFPIMYKAIVFRPFKGEVVDGSVTQVTSMGFFAAVGPLSVFVSKHLIDEEMEYDAQTNSFQATEGEGISEGDEVRLKIEGTRFDSTEIFAIGSVKDDYLGPLA